MLNQYHNMKNVMKSLREKTREPEFMAKVLDAQASIAESLSHARFNKAELKKTLEKQRREWLGAVAFLFHADRRMGGI